MNIETLQADNRRHLQRIAALEGELNRIQEGINAAGYTVEQAVANFKYWMADAENAKAQLKAAQEQEPVAYCRRDDFENIDDFVATTEPHELYTVKLYAAPVPAQQAPAVAVPDYEALASRFEFSVESKVFEQYAAKSKMNMSQHPLHYLFLDNETSVARDAWRAAMNYAVKSLAEFSSSPRITEQELREYLYSVKEFINNGVEFGFIRLPELQDDPANRLLPSTCALLDKLNGVKSE